jgi:hypothetical protein
MADPVVAVERFLYTTLTGDATLAAIVGTRVFGHAVPPAATRPYVFYTLVDPGEDLSEVGAVRIWSNMIYVVRIVNKTESYPSLEAGSTAITNALHRASGSNISGAVVACIKEAPFAFIEIDQDGSQLRHLGSRFRLFVQ